jgi:hypothetical protein
MEHLVRSKNIVLDKEYILVLDFNALIKFKHVTGKDISQLAEGTDMEAIRALVWAAMQRHQPDMTLEEVGALLDMQTLEPALKAVLELAGVDATKADAEATRLKAGDVGKKPKKPPGKKSGR